MIHNKDIFEIGDVVRLNKEFIKNDNKYNDIGNAIVESCFITASGAPIIKIRFLKHPQYNGGWFSHSFEKVIADNEKICRNK